MMTQPTTPHSIRNHLAAYGFFLALALLITWPLLTVLSTSFAGYPFGDAHEMTRHIWWFKYALQHGQPLIFQPLLGYPDGISGVILWSDPLQFFPGWLFAFVMPLPAAYNIQCLLNLALNGWAAYFLMWKLTDQQRFPALLAGIVFMTAPVMQGHLAGGHGGLLVQWPLPLLAWALINLRSEGDTRTRHVVSLRKIFPAVLFFVLLPFGHTLQLIYAGMPLIGVFGLTLLVKRDWRALGRLIVVVVLGSVILLLFLMPVFQSTLGTSAYTEEGGGVAFSMDLLGVVTPSFNHPLFGQLDYTHRVLGVNIVEGSGYVGIIAGLLALVALWKNRAARWWLFLAAVAWILALGPLLKIFDAPITLRSGEYSTFITLPWSLVADLLGFNLARTPGRFGFVMALAVAVMAGYGAAWIWKKTDAWNIGVRTRYSVSLRVASAVVIGAFVIADYQSFWPLPTYSAAIPQAVHDLATRDDVRAVFDAPWENVLAAKDALWLQTAHEKPMIGGQVTRKTPVSPAKLTILEQTFDPALLKDAGADVVILHKQYDSDGKLAENAREKLGDPFYEDGQLALFNVRETPTSGAGSPYILSENLPAQVTDRIDTYVYADSPGWVDYFTRFYVDAGKWEVLLDNKLLHKAQVTNIGEFSLTLPIIEAGYHTITLALQPPCPAQFSNTLQCDALRVTDLSASLAIPAVFNATNFDHAVTLSGATDHYIDCTPHNCPTLARIGLFLSLWWKFGEARTEQDIRFVKVLSQDGNQVAGVDETLGAQPAGGQWVETMWLDLPDDILPGTYRICVGWYSYPDLTRFAVLSDVDGAQDGLACISEFTVPAP